MRGNLLESFWIYFEIFTLHFRSETLQGPLEYKTTLICHHDRLSGLGDSGKLIPLSIRDEIDRVICWNQQQ